MQSLQLSRKRAYVFGRSRERVSLATLPHQILHSRLAKPHCPPPRADSPRADRGRGPSQLSRLRLGHRPRRPPESPPRDAPPAPPPPPRLCCASPRHVHDTSVTRPRHFARRTSPCQTSPCLVRTRRLCTALRPMAAATAATATTARHRCTSLTSARPRAAAPRSGMSTRVFQPALERTRTPLYSTVFGCTPCVRTPRLSRGAL